MEHLLKEFKKRKYLTAIPFLLIPFAAFQCLDVFYIVATMLIAVFTTKNVIEKRKEFGLSFVISNIITDILILFYMASGYPAAQLLMYSLVLFTVYFTYKKRPEISLIQAAYISQIIIVILVNSDTYWTVSYSLLIILYGLFSLAFFTSIFNYKTAVILYFGFQVILRVANIYYSGLRFAKLGIMDIFAIPTFLTIAGEYDYTPDPNTVLYLIICLCCTVPLLLVKNYRLNKYIKTKVITGVLSLAFFFGIGFRADYIWKNEDRDGRAVYYLDTFALSAVEQARILLHTPSKELQITTLQNFDSDSYKEDEIHPHIITIMSESYADIVKILELDVNEDPLHDFYQLENNKNCQVGEVHVMTAGGGTSISEWEYLTGLNCANYSVMRIPFATDVNKNYAFTADSLYNNYRKNFFHPYRNTGWNRPHVYKTFDYDTVIFANDITCHEDDLVRRFIGDEYLTDHIINELEHTEQPLFSMNVSVQNHGGYGDDNGILKTGDIQVQNSKYTDEETQKMEAFLQLEKISTNALVRLIDYLEEHPEHPTLLVFFGDHYPSDIPMAEKDGKNLVSYETPYLVYSNYTELKQMPNYMDLSLLYPYAKQSAGIPLSSWEKYLLSLNGETADREMILARIKYGHVEENNNR